MSRQLIVSGTWSNKMITITVKQDGEAPYAIGAVLPPDELLADTRAGEPGFWHAVVLTLWQEWREAVPHPDSDSQFIDWLQERGWAAREPDVLVTLEV